MESLRFFITFIWYACLFFFFFSLLIRCGEWILLLPLLILSLYRIVSLIWIFDSLFIFVVVVVIVLLWLVSIIINLRHAANWHQLSFSIGFTRFWIRHRQTMCFFPFCNGSCYCFYSNDDRARWISIDLFILIASIR